MSPTTSSNPAGSDTGLPSNVGAGICAIFTLIGGVIFYFIEKKDQLVRHWAVQAIFFGGTWMAFAIAVRILAIVFHGIPAIGWLMGGLLVLATVLVDIALTVLWIVGIIKAFQGQRWEYPYISEQCKKLFPSLA